MTELLEKFGVTEFYVFMPNGVASRVCDDQFFENMCSVYESLSVEDKPTFRKFFALGVGQLKKEKDPANFWLKVGKNCKMRPVPSRKEALRLIKL